MQLVSFISAETASASHNKNSDHSDEPDASLAYPRCQHDFRGLPEPDPVSQHLPCEVSA